jgi:cholesterol oxidase
VRFTEEMLGHVTFNEEDYGRGALPDRPGAGALMFHLTIEIDDIERFASDPTRQGSANGWIRSDVFGGKLPVERGVFNLFVDQDDGSKLMLYRLWFHDRAGHPLTFAGFKLVRDDPGFDVWKDTTTLFTRVLRGHVEADEDAGAELVASGVLRIRIRDFARQLTTFRAGGPGPGAQAGALARFSGIFAAQLAEAYLQKGIMRRGRA